MRSRCARAHRARRRARRRRRRRGRFARPAGSASRRAATIARMLVGSCCASAVDLSASDAASSSMKSGLPSAVSATVCGGLFRRLEPREQQRRELARVVAGERIERKRGVGGQATRPARALVQQLRPARARGRAPARRERARRASRAGRAGSRPPSGCPRTGGASAPLRPRDSTRMRAEKNSVSRSATSPFSPSPMSRERCAACSAAASAPTISTTAASSFARASGSSSLS